MGFILDQEDKEEFVQRKVYGLVQCIKKVAKSAELHVQTEKVYAVWTKFLQVEWCYF